MKAANRSAARNGGLLARTSVCAIASATAMLPLAALAQDDEIVVTGSRIPSANAISSSPVTTIGNVEFDIRGTTRVEDMTNTLPQVFAAQGSNTSNGATGTAQVALRGLGPNRTLVLVNGRRLQYGSPISAAPDLNQIPSALVERVEVLTGGASAVYGSDAVAGVVNFIMMDDFEGVRIDGQLSGYQHSNDNEQAQNILLSNQPAPFGSDYSIPEGGVFDGKGQELTLIIGANTPDGRGNVTAYAGYRNNDAILQADRDYSKCSYGGGDPEFGCVGSSTTPAGRFFTTWGDFTLDDTGPGDTFRPRLASDTFNYAPTNFYQRPDERWTLGAFARYEVNEHLEFYTETAMYDYFSDAQIAFTGTFFATSSVNCDNPLIGTTPNANGFSQLDLLCGAPDPGPDGIVGPLAGPDGIVGTVDDINDDPGTPIPGSGSTAGGDVPFFPGKRFVEGSARNYALRNTSFRQVAGIRGNIVDSWTYDAYFQYANTHGSNQYEQDGVIANIQNALFAVSDGAGGVQCRDSAARAAGCVPLNLFQVGAVTQNQLNYVLQPSFQDGNTRQYLGEIVLTGDLGDYGIRLPWASDGVGIAGGMQWRKETLDYNPDGLFQTGGLTGQGGPAPAVSGEIETTDFYVEAVIPLVTDMEFAERLAFEGGFRRSDVSTAGSYSTWKLAGDWQIVPELRVRGGWQRAARAPNIFEAFSPQAIGLTNLPGLPNGQEDPCAGDLVFTDVDGDGVDDVNAPARSAAECARTGVTAGQYGTIVGNPAQQYNALFGGNPDLGVEQSDTYSVGVVLTPNEYVPGNMLVSVDYFDITVNGFISAVSAETTLNHCLDTGLDSITTSTGDIIPICDAVNRDTVGTLWLLPSGFISAVNLNTGSLSTSGLDLNMNWNFDFDEIGLGSAGGFEIDFVATYLLDLVTDSLPENIVPEFDCAGYYGGRCGSPKPEWRHKLRTTWQTPIGVDVSTTWRMFSSVTHGDSEQGPVSATTDRDYQLNSRHYIDLAASYNIADNWNVRVGVNNLLDKDPPLTSQTAGFSNGNTYPQTYDAQGRFLFVGTTIDF